jgi:hypothetical protein
VNNYTQRIISNIIDIRQIENIKGKTFFVDTNVWFWFLSTTGYGNGQNYQTEAYPNFISDIFSSNKLYACVANLIELSYLIEDTCYKIYCDENDIKIGKKTYRYEFPEERKRIVEEINSVWKSLKDYASILDTEIKAGMDINNILESITSGMVDAYDAIMLNNMKKYRIDCIISDDFDFSSIPNISIYTANNRVIAGAKSCNKLKN